MIAAATIAPSTIADSPGSITLSDAAAIPVNTSETPECGKSVKPRDFVTAGGRFGYFSADKRAAAFLLFRDYFVVLPDMVVYPL